MYLNIVGPSLRGLQPHGTLNILSESQVRILPHTHTHQRPTLVDPAQGPTLLACGRNVTVCVVRRIERTLFKGLHEQHSPLPVACHFV
jgi:hypothetical protein